MRRDLSTLDRDIGQDWSRIIQEAFKHGIDGAIMQGGLLPGREVQGIHEVSDTQNYLLESRLMTRDGRVFYYAKAGAACWTGLGCKFYGKLKWGGQTAAIAKEDSKTVMIRNNAVPFTEDELYGGYLLLHHDNGNMQNRRILANDANPSATARTITVATKGPAGVGSFGVAGNDITSQFTKGTKITVYGSAANDGIYTVKADATFDTPTTTITVEEAVVDDTAGGEVTGVVTLTLEEGLSGEFPEANWTEILPNSYADLQGGLTSANTKASVAGVPGAKAATGDYFWVQTWGPCWITPGGPVSAVGVGANERTVVFVGDNSINAKSDITSEGTGYQVAGFIIQNDADGSGPPLIMLHIRP